MEVDEDATLEELAAALERADVEEIAEALEEALKEGWTVAIALALEAAENAFQNGATPQETIGVMRSEVTRVFPRRVTPQLNEAVEMTYRIGQREVNAGGISQAGRESINMMNNTSAFWVDNHWERHVQDRIRGVGGDVIEEGLGAFRGGRRFAESSLGQEFGKSQSYWELMSNSVTTRTRELSHIDGFVQRGVEEVEINAVLDSRTSCVCRTLDGTRFDTETLASFKEEMMDADSPEDITNNVSPWLPCSRVQSLKSQGPEALADAGVVSPPFHGHCRSTLTVPL